MTLRGFWGFDSGSATNIYPEWSGWNAATGRDGVANHGSGLFSNSSSILTVPGASLSGLIIGFWVAKGTWPAATTRPLPQFNGSAGALGLIRFGGPSGNDLVLTVGSTDVQTTGLNWLASTDHYLEVKYVPHLTAGTLVVRVDEQVVLNFTGQTASSTSPVTSMTFVNGAGTNGVVDDMYLLDLTDGTATDGRPNNDFLGDIKVMHGIPTSDGATVAWTPSTAGAHFGLVDETPPNTTDYVTATAATGLKDLYNVTDLPGTATTVYGLRVIPYVMKTDAGAATIKALIRENSVDSAVSGSLGVGTAFASVYSDFVKLRPSIGGVFTVADANSLQIGVQAA